MTTPVLEFLKKTIPECKITYLVDSNYAPLLKGHEYIDNLIEIKWSKYEKKPLKLFGEIIKTIKKIRKQKFSLAFDFQGLFRSALFLYSCKSQKKYARGKWMFMTGTKPHKKKLAKHNVEQNYEITALAGLNKTQNHSQNIDNAVEAVDLSRISDTHIQSFDKIVLINPFTRWQTKNIPLKTLSEAANIIGSKIRCHFVVLGSKNELTHARQVYENITRGKTLLCGKLNLNQLAGIIKQGELLITGDSGPMHMASALNTPLVAVFGPTHPVRTGPYEGIYEIIQSEENCSPCFSRNCKHAFVKCMANVKAEEIADRAIELLATQKPVYIG